MLFFQLSRTIWMKSVHEYTNICWAAHWCTCAIFPITQFVDLLIKLAFIWNVRHFLSKNLHEIYAHASSSCQSETFDKNCGDIFSLFFTKLLLTKSLRPRRWTNDTLNFIATIIFGCFYTFSSHLSFGFGDAVEEIVFCRPFTVGTHT